MRRLALVLALLALPAGGRTEEVVAALSQTDVSITTGFTGSEIFVWGAIKREAPPPDQQLDIVVAVTGPPEKVVLRQKEWRYGIWLNGEGVQIDSAPSLYVVATTRPFDEAMSHTDNLRYRVGLDNAIRLIDAPIWVKNVESYRQALIRLRQGQGLYFVQEGGVRLHENTLFDARIRLPARLTEGDYRARIFLLRDRKVVDVEDVSILVRKVGLERWIYRLAQDHGWLYGLLSIAVALAAGWLASAFFRRFFP